MKKVVQLNKSIEQETENIDAMITELVEREEFLCSGNGCGAAACAIKDV